MPAAGFKQSRLDPCLFVCQVTDVAVLPYVDDFLFCGEPGSVERIILTLRSKLDASEPHYLCFLGEKLSILGRTSIRTAYGLAVQTYSKHCAAVVAKIMCGLLPRHLMCV
jgi:hypothetical protein